MVTAIINPNYILMLDNILKLEGVKKLEKSEQKQVNGGGKRRNPCWPTGYDVVDHITSEEGCFGYGFFWWGGRCIVCH